MVTRKEKKSRKLRGYRTHGYGRVGQHRKSGSKGGVGNAGRKSGKHKWSWVLRYEPDYFGKHGFVRPNRKYYNAINLSQISNIAFSLIEKGILKPNENGYYEIDLAEWGYDKVLSNGSLNNKFIIKAKFFSEKALEKIKSLGSIPVVKNDSS
ncbi:MAG: uL15 family ribosomal protein [Thermoproteota archaeon]|jgi:large subunit ribosomal protein L15